MLSEKDRKLDAARKRSERAANRERAKAGDAIALERLTRDRERKRAERACARERVSAGDNVASKKLEQQRAAAANRERAR